MSFYEIITFTPLIISRTQTTTLGACFKQSDSQCDVKDSSSWEGIFTFSLQFESLIFLSKLFINGVQKPSIDNIPYWR